jgi:uncharacterized protein (DUF433 family)
MALTIHDESVPLRVDGDGSVRVGATGIALDAVLAHHRSGAPANEIADRFLEVTPADIHAALAYYSRHKEEIDAYLAERDRHAPVTFHGLNKPRQAAPEVRYKPARGEFRPLVTPTRYRYGTPAWHEGSEPDSHLGLWAITTLGVIVLDGLIFPFTDYYGRTLGGYLIHIFASLPWRVVWSCQTADLFGFLFYGILLFAPAITIGWVLHAIILLTARAIWKRRTAVTN